MRRSEEHCGGQWRPLFLGVSVALLSLAAGCFHQHGAQLVAFTDAGKLMVRGDCRTRSKGCTPLKPTEADLYASERYDEYKESGFVTLKPHMQLRIVAPVMRASSISGGIRGLVASDGGTAQGSNITVRAGSDLAGYETAVYSVIESKNGSVAISLNDMTVQPIGKHSDEGLRHTDYLSSITKPAFVRLYFQLRHAPASHPQVLLIGDSQGELNEASGEFEPSPDAYCGATHPHARCLVFPPFTAVNVEIRVFVRKRAVHVPLSATVSDALVAAGIADPKSKLKKLRVRRIWDGHPVPLTYDRETTPILGLTLAGDDRIGF